jgi:hypothetical protein
MRCAVTIRVPHSWRERLDSEAMTRWREDFFSAPYLLPDDPGSGDARICLSLPEKLMKRLAWKARCPAATALRRLAAAHSRELCGDALQMAFPCDPVATRHLRSQGKGLLRRFRGGLRGRVLYCISRKGRDRLTWLRGL